MKRKIQAQNIKRTYLVINPLSNSYLQEQDDSRLVQIKSIDEFIQKHKCDLSSLYSLTYEIGSILNQDDFEFINAYLNNESSLRKLVLNGVIIQHNHSVNGVNFMQEMIKNLKINPKVAFKININSFLMTQGSAYGSQEGSKDEVIEYVKTQPLKSLFDSRVELVEIMINDINNSNNSKNIKKNNPWLFKNMSEVIKDLSLIVSSVRGKIKNEKDKLDAFAKNDNNKDSKYEHTDDIMKLCKMNLDLLDSYSKFMKLKDFLFTSNKMSQLNVLSGKNYSLISEAVKRSGKDEVDDEMPQKKMKITQSSNFIGEGYKSASSSKGLVLAPAVKGEDDIDLYCYETFGIDESYKSASSTTEGEIDLYCYETDIIGEGA